MYSKLQSLRTASSNSISLHPGNLGIKSSNLGRRPASFTRGTVIRAENTGPGGVVVGSPHPDAVRRRREAEERRLQRAAALEATLAATQGRSTHDVSSNVCEIEDSSELRFRLSLGSANDKLVVAHFKAAWCSACARMQYKVGQIAKQNPDVTFLIVDVSKSSDLLNAATELGVQELPSFMFYKNKEFLSQIKCNLSKIDTLRAEIACHKGSSGETPDVQVYSQMEN